MGRRVSAGGGQSSLGYLFGGGEAPTSQGLPNETSPPPTSQGLPNEPSVKNSGASQPAEGGSGKQAPAGASGVSGYAKNNYFRADGQNCGNFITDRPSTKVHAAPGGGSSLNYLFGGGSK